VNFVNHAYGRCGPAVPIEDAKRRVIEIPKGMQAVGDLADDKTTAVFLHSIDGLAIGKDGVIEYDLQPVVLDGVWDLTMAGAERLDVEHRYQQLTGGPAVTLVFLEGPILRRDDGAYCQVMQHFSENEFADPKTLKSPYHHPSNFFPAGSLPADSVLVVRTSSLLALQTRLSESDQKLEKPIERRERSTLLVIVAALCKLAKIDLTKPSAAAVTIESETVRMGARVATRTIENHLKLIPEALESRSS
jgi:hypothetical protein